jgi:hypothetical protein
VIHKSLFQGHNEWEERKTALTAAEGRIGENCSMLSLFSYPEDGGSTFKQDGVRYQKTLIFTVTAVRTSDVTEDLTSLQKECVFYFHFIQ